MTAEIRQRSAIIGSIEAVKTDQRREGLGLESMCLPYFPPLVRKVVSRTMWTREDLRMLEMHV